MRYVSWKKYYQNWIITLINIAIKRLLTSGYTSG